ncbi:hypothetical protein LLH23_06525 [bacterium]|nr:hypothetical protein [bacterium]
MPALLSSVIAVLIAAVVCAAGPPTVAYTPDDHTLLLHHFEGNTGHGGMDADFARGNPSPVAGGGAPTLVAGKIGQAFLFAPSYRGLLFAGKGNYNPKQGTVEFWMRLPALVPGAWRATKGLWQTYQGDLAKSRLVICVGDFNSARTASKPTNLVADLLDGQLGLKTDIGNWKPDEWHHVALLWDAQTARLLLDGVRVAEGKHPPLEAAPVFEVGSNTVEALDELRISDVMRTELEVSNAVKQETSFKPLADSKPEAPRPLPPLPSPPPRPAVVELKPGVPNLFVDDYLIETQTSLIRRLGQVTKVEQPVIRAEGLWEETAAFPFSGGALRLGDNDWRLWYQTYIRWRLGKDGTSLCYATSKDGVHWEKPKLGQFEIRGGKDNNAVLHMPMDNASVLYDPDDKDPQRRYKCVVYQSLEEGTGCYGYTSPDGIKWTRTPHILIKGAGDRTSAWYDPLRHKCVIFTRYNMVYPGRYIFQSESDDFEHWTEPQLLFDYSAIDKPKGVQHYGAGGFAYGDMYVGSLEMFHVPYRRLDTQLICSRDAKFWQRVCDGEVLLPNGPEGSFDHFWAFPAATAPIRVGKELWFYYAGRGHPHAGPAPPIWPGEDDVAKPHQSYWASTGLAKLRVDGFAAMDASGEVATLITVPLQLRGLSPEGRPQAATQGADPAAAPTRGQPPPGPAGRPGTDPLALFINADADNFPAGSSWLKVGLMTPDFTPIPGFEADKCTPLKSDSVEWQATWEGKPDLSKLAGQKVRLQFQLLNTRLYSFTVR